MTVAYGKPRREEITLRRRKRQAIVSHRIASSSDPSLAERFGFASQDAFLDTSPGSLRNIRESRCISKGSLPRGTACCSPLPPARAGGILTGWRLTSTDLMIREGLSSTRTCSSGSPRIQRRRTVWYKCSADRPVSEDDLRSLFEAARWAASSYNEQRWSYIVATKADPDGFNRLLSCLVEGNQAWPSPPGNDDTSRRIPNTRAWLPC